VGPGYVSKVTWQFIGRRGGADIYAFQDHVVLPGGRDPIVKRPGVEYAGKEEVVFSNDFGIITEIISIIP